MFVHWSNQKAEYRDMESRTINCQKCNKTTQHTFRYHITKTKHYSVVSVGPGKKDISLVCHVCLSETFLDKNDSKELIKEYDNVIAVGEANELMSKGKDSKAESKLKKVLKKDPDHGQALYSMSKCLISQARYGEAKSYIKNLEDKFPNAPEIKELQDELPPELDIIEPKTPITSSSNEPEIEIPNTESDNKLSDYEADYLKRVEQQKNDKDKEDKEKKLDELQKRVEKANRELEEKKRRKKNFTNSQPIQNKNNPSKEKDNSKKVKEVVKTNKLKMNLSKIDECLLLNHEMRNAGIHVKEQYGDDAAEELHNMVFANTTDDEWKSFQIVNNTITDLFVRRRYDVWNFMISEKAVKEMYPDGPPPIVNVDHNLMPPETLQLGLYLLWERTSVVKDEGEDKESFERRKDWHDFLNGYVNQEAIQRPLIEITEVFEELSKKREIIKNYIGIMVRSRNR